MRKKDRQTKSTAQKADGRRMILLSAVAVVLIGAVRWRWHDVRGDSKTEPPLTTNYVGTERCAECHTAEADAWRTSHHARTMQVANQATVLGNFNSVHFAGNGMTANFQEKGGKFFVNTQDPDGKPSDFDFLVQRIGRLKLLVGI